MNVVCSRRGFNKVSVDMSWVQHFVSFVLLQVANQEITHHSSPEWFWIWRCISTQLVFVSVTSCLRVVLRSHWTSTRSRGSVCTPFRCVFVERSLDIVKFWHFWAKACHRYICLIGLNCQPLLGMQLWLSSCERRAENVSQSSFRGIQEKENSHGGSLKCLRLSGTMFYHIFAWTLWDDYMI